MSAWVHFRTRWLKPEVYPLIGAMTAALSIGGYALYNKTRDTTVSWNKNRRLTDSELTHKVEAIPTLTAVRGKSTSVFESDRKIFEAQYAQTISDAEPMKFTVVVGEAVEDVEELVEEASEEVVAVVDAVVDQVEKSKVAVPDVDINDAPEAVQKALDAALDVIHGDAGDKTTTSAGSPSEASA